MAHATTNTPGSNAPGVAAQAFAQAKKVLDQVAADPTIAREVDLIAAVLAAAFKAGNKVLICGNGGSLADATHFAEELTGRFRSDRPALPAIAIADAGHLTCVANDYGFERVFSRAVEALGKPGDVLIVLSTSGNSPNVRLAATTANQRGVTTVALLGKGGGAIAGLCAHQITVPGETADRIQELHMLILHTLVEGVERAMGFT
jgi:D-sedoheptulose 7-phosphate isomerase